MDYNISVNSITISKFSMTLGISIEIIDDDIDDLAPAKPKLILFFDNGLETRRIPFVIKTVNYIKNRCLYTGKYKYALNMLYWKTRPQNLGSRMHFNLSYGKFYKENIKVDFSEAEIECDDFCYSIEIGDNSISLFTHPENFNYGKNIKAIRKFFRNIFYGLMYIMGLIFIPVWALEAVLNLLKITSVAKKVKSKNPFRRIFGNVNERLSQFSKRKITMHKIKRGLLVLLYKLQKGRKIQDRKITFISQRRNDLSGNFEFVYDKLKDDTSLNIKFILDNKPFKKKSLLYLIKFTSALATSKVIVLDEFTPQIHFVDLKPQTKLVQLWHACGAFKTFGFTRLGKPKGSPQATRNHRSYDYVTVSSTYCKRCHSEGFGIPDENVVPTGIARTDVFFDEQYKQKVIAEFYNQYPQFKGKKIILFAPTFRGNVQETAHYPMHLFDLEKVFDEIGSEYVIIIKHHPFIKSQHPIPEQYSERVIDLSQNSELNDLLFVSDLIITDYSSLVFEAALIKKPMLFYAFDLRGYINSRDFYFDFKSYFPGKIVYNLKELIQAINERDYDTGKMQEFAKMFFDDFDGKSTERVVKLLYRCLEE